jgi:hypothetical protein
MLLNGAPDRCAEHPKRRLHSRWTYRKAWAPMINLGGARGLAYAWT